MPPSLFQSPRLDFLYFSNENFAVGVMVSVPVPDVFAIGHHFNGFTGWAVLYGFVVWDRKSFAFYVGLHPEVGEEEEEEDAVHPD